MISLIYSLLAVIVISLISVVGLYLIISIFPRFVKSSVGLVGIAVGSLLGDAFIHILPEIYNQITNSTLVSLLVIAGILLFFILEKILKWRHCHNPDCDDISGNHIVTVSLVGDLFHNFIDGAIIFAAFQADIKIGFATALAVLIHEIPQEAGDFGIYLHQGLSLKKALNLNLLSALSSLIGIAVALLIGSLINNLSNYILPITAGGFIYLAASDLIPELHRHQPKIDRSLLQILQVVSGVMIMLFLKYLD